jgi:hypothetical protein
MENLKGLSKNIADGVYRYVNRNFEDSLFLIESGGIASENQAKMKVEAIIERNTWHKKLWKAGHFEPVKCDWEPTVALYHGRGLTDRAYSQSVAIHALATGSFTKYLKQNPWIT